MAAVEELYKNFGILADAGDKANEHPEAYEKILNATKGVSAEKKLACQFIPRFFKYFPSMSDTAIDAQLDLCEDDETPIRRQAIRSLTEFCKTSGGHVTKITDILTQLLQQEDSTELKIVRSGLEMLIMKDPEAALGGIFSQITLGDDPVREKAIAFLYHLTAGNVLEGKSGEFLLQEVRKILSDVTGEEFTSFVSILTKVKSISSNPQNLADIITEQAELDKDFQPLEPESLDRLICCTRQASPFFLKGASPSRFLHYLFSNVLPVLNDIIITDAGDYKYEVLKLIAELSVFVTQENVKDYLRPMYKKLLEYIPLPPDAEESDEDAIQKLNFSFTECFMYSLHKLGAKSPEFFTSVESEENIKDFRMRLTYFGRMVQVYIKQLQSTLQTKGNAELEESENQMKVMALKTCNNINIMIKDLLHNPPSYKSNITVSWKSKTTLVVTTDETLDEKRKRAGITPISLDNLPAKKEKITFAGKGKIYALPTARKGIEMGDNYTGRKRQQDTDNSGFDAVTSTGNKRGNGNRWRGKNQRGGSGGAAGGRQKEYESFLMR